MCFGTSPTGDDTLGLCKLFVASIHRQFPDMQLGGAMVSNDRKRIVFEATFTQPGQGSRYFRCWVTGCGQDFTCTSIETPEQEFAENLSRIRRSALNLLRQVKSVKVGAKAKRLKACLEEEYLRRILCRAF
ncbi:MAG: hypothetical protein GXY44_16925 [Phycisphaerales bacterium]|nr:hypothetical protein [Phycisphaerales bacterium]